MKDQTKKVASLKHKEQVEKSRNARLMEEARKREDNMSETSQQVKVTLVCMDHLDLVDPAETFAVPGTDPFLVLPWRTPCVRSPSASRSLRRPWERAFRSPPSERWCLPRRRLPGRCRRSRYAPSWQSNVNKTTPTVRAYVNTPIYRYHTRDSFSLTFLLPLWCVLIPSSAPSSLTSLSVLLSLLVVFSLCFFLCYTLPLRSTHSNQCMSPPSPT